MLCSGLGLHFPLGCKRRSGEEENVKLKLTDPQNFQPTLLGKRNDDVAGLPVTHLQCAVNDVHLVLRQRCAADVGKKVVVVVVVSMCVL